MTRLQPLVISTHPLLPGVPGHWCVLDVCQCACLFWPCHALCWLTMCFCAFCAACREETQHISKFDYVVVNREGQLDECVAQLGAIIDAEKLRTRK